MLEGFLSPAGFFVVILAFAMGAVGALLFGKNDRLANAWGNGFAVFGSVLCLVFSSAILSTGLTLAFRISSSFPLLSLSFRIDPLAAFFMLLISLISLFCSLFALGYVKHYYTQYSVGVLGFFTTSSLSA